MVATTTLVQYFCLDEVVLLPSQVAPTGQLHDLYKMCEADGQVALGLQLHETCNKWAGGGKRGVCIRVLCTSKITETRTSGQWLPHTASLRARVDCATMRCYETIFEIRS